MRIKTIQDLLPLVEQPTRYLGSEVNAVKKDLSSVKLSMALVFPDLYEIGTSHFGIQILYDILNKCDDIAAERVYAPAKDMEEYLRKYNIPLSSLESSIPVNSFDIIGFSLLYELNFTNVINLLDLAKIPFLSKKRNSSHPIIIAGGPCTCNPEPVADFFDAMVIGDGENVILEISRTWMEWKNKAGGKKEHFLEEISKTQGVYVPAFFTAKYKKGPDGLKVQKLEPKYTSYKKITRTIVPELETVTFPDSPIVPFARPVHDRLRIELSRGCTRGCRFCQAGMIYRPVRERSPQKLLMLTDRSIQTTGYEELSLLSLSSGDYGSLMPLLERLMNSCESKKIAVSFPSLRAGTLTPELMKLIKKVRKTGFTIAPEAGSQRLRDIINKNITEKEIFETVQSAFGLGWKLIKLYFMIGLPTETDEDVQAIVDLVKSLRKIKGPDDRKGNINVSISTFIPKPHTPFQWEPQISLKESKDKIEWIKRRLNSKGIHVKWQNPEVSLIEGLFSRGDRRLAKLLVKAFEKGCKFDGWSDSFDFHLWREAISDSGIDIDYFTTRKRNVEEPLPWDHMDSKVDKAFLLKELSMTAEGEKTMDCRLGDCNHCGVCDFDTIEPRVYFDFNTKPDEIKSLQNKGNDLNAVCAKRFKVFYSKTGKGKYYGHLEMSKVIFRALRRAEIPVMFSQGFHPMPKVSFDDPLPIGIESEREFFYLTANKDISPEIIIDGLNKHLPEGLKAIDCMWAPQKESVQKPKEVEYNIVIGDGEIDKKKLTYFLQAVSFIVERANKKGKIKTIELKEMVPAIEITGKNALKMKILNESGKTVRPTEVLRSVFGLSEEAIKLSRIIKCAELNGI
ncbi:MAG: TIGR03960 family B12-binding radical SAM protein [Deltaproteobacteria bacterium]|nr:TIGR03960 family B12-binding radical SAM protein [Deltaproteobacteria bacterium]